MKFKYDDAVKVKEGFYEGLTGRVRDYDKENDSYYFICYIHPYNTISIWIKSEILEKNERI